jgi:hypothetical protein
MIAKGDTVEIQLKVPMSLTIVLKREQAEWMFRDQLAEVIDAILSQCSTEEMKEVTTQVEIVSGQEIDVDYRIDPYWDLTSDEEVEFISTEEELFPFDKSGNEDEDNQ